MGIADIFIQDSMSFRRHHVERFFLRTDPLQDHFRAFGLDDAIFRPLDEGCWTRYHGQPALEFGDHVPLENRAMIYWFTVLIAINLQTSFLTPPFGYALFYLKGIAPREVNLMSIYRGIIPFVILQLAALIIVITLPNIALWLPGLN